MTTEPLVQLFEVVAESHGGISPDELREHFTVLRDWADRECLTASDASAACALGRKRVPFGDTVRERQG